MGIVKENTHCAFNCSHIRLSHKSHMVPLDVILGLSVETIVRVFFFPLVVLPVATKNEDLAMIYILI